MSVDFFPCAGCGESICDCGEYFICEGDCERSFCSKECGKLKKNENDQLVCKFCRLEAVDDSDLLAFMLKTYNLSRKKAVELYVAKKRLEKIAV